MTTRSGLFVGRHVWSLSLASLSLLSFLALTIELKGDRLDAFDSALAGAIQSLRGSIDGPMYWASRSGDFHSLLALGIGLPLALLGLRWRREARFTAVCYTGGFVLSIALKAFFRRARPPASGGYLLPMSKSPSFPSSHAMGSACIIGCLLIILTVRLPRAWHAPLITLGIAYVLAVAMSRVYFGMHYPSDVLGGCLASAAWVTAATGWFYPLLLPHESGKFNAVRLDG
ncbi:MAG TPA: phosphatase PAP2 family protein [Polyangiaceae bacterium]|jgi:undecaprenyl-diphosphatase|nr:phosphatase PAP2 family protein [Polyangiaceae bacterium]